MSKRKKIPAVRVVLNSGLSTGVSMSELLQEPMFFNVRVDRKCLMVLQRLATEKRFADEVDKLLRRP